MSAIEAPTQSSPAASAWRVWLDEHAPKLFLFARQQTRSHEDAQDVLQDAVVKLVEKIRAGEFVGGQQAWQPYLYTTIRRLAIDLSRKNDRRTKRENNVSADTESLQQDAFHPWFDNEGGDEETRSQLEDALKALPEKFSEVIIMKVWGERTFAEIGKALEISQNTAASRYRYGLEALKRELGTARMKGDLSI
ncbi:MAG: RNA polymerase sigma factor [Verrucomicrobia bacterium]|jgi:RNA polymerase sigma-70 factor (ECF subfamily)|nr:RNA polymerase sigma factor [Verrucomicrobiota bacterium]|tara:strand:- start:1493 stop:2071 length:579 start_codon:yes stop_codon:yes gene_type:complete